MDWPILVISIAVLLLSDVSGAALAWQPGTAAKQAVGPASTLPSSGQTFLSPGRRLYLATAGKGGLDRWSGTSEWTHVRHAADSDAGDLYNDGSKFNSLVIAPYNPGSRADYEVEADIQVWPGHCPAGFGIVVRWTNNQGPYSCTDCDGHAGIWVGALEGARRMIKRHFEETWDWHTYRFEVHGTTLVSWVDGQRLMQTTDNGLRGYQGGRIGLWTHGDQLIVRRVEVCAGTGYPCDLTVK
jgi:hypothetical protein